MSHRVSYIRAKGFLATLWSIGSLLPVLFMIVFTITGRFHELTSEVWGWLLQSVMPTLTLVVTVLVADERGQGVAKTTASRLLFRITFGLATVYLLTVLGLIVFIQPANGGQGGVSTLQNSSIFLGPIQGLVGASFGVFFINREKEE